jgi:hypothetical protein
MDASAGIRTASTAALLSIWEKGTPARNALACKLIVEGGLRITEISSEVRYCLRDLNLPKPGG